MRPVFPTSAALLLAGVTTLALTGAASAVTLETTDFIADGDRTNFVDFEHLPDDTSLADVTSFDGVTVTQVNGTPNNIWSTCGLFCWTSNATKSWYPNGGDAGYTEITRTGGGVFGNISLERSTGYGPGVDTVHYSYEVLLGGSSLLFGSFSDVSGGGFIGFSGGGFDTVRLAGGFVQVGSFGDGTFQALTIDNIELSAVAPVPLPATLPLVLGGLGALTLARRRRRG